MTDVLIDAFWFFLPAGVANISPVLAANAPLIRRWDKPVHRRLLGDHKTWRGLTSGVIAAAMAAWLVHTAFDLHIWGSTEQSALIAGAALGGGALIGDSVKSFFKRRIGVKPGSSWFPFDQTDYIVGGLLFVAPFVTLSLNIVLGVFALYFGLHLLVSYIGYLAGLKNTPI